MSINPTLNALVNKQIRHSQAISHYQRAQRTMFAQIKRVGFDDLSPQNVSEWFCCIENTIAELNKLAIEIDKRYEMSNLKTTHEQMELHTRKCIEEARKLRSDNSFTRERRA
jgi:hypothetical protein